MLPWFALRGHRWANFAYWSQLQLWKWLFRLHFYVFSMNNHCNYCKNHLNKIADWPWFSADFLKHCWSAIVFEFKNMTTFFICFFNFCRNISRHLHVEAESSNFQPTLRKEISNWNITFLNLLRSEFFECVDKIKAAELTRCRQFLVLVGPIVRTFEVISFLPFFEPIFANTGKLKS